MTEKKDFIREDIEFDADGDMIRGWLFRPPEPAEPTPAVVLGNGFACVKEMNLPDTAARFAAAGLASIVFDFRNLGGSDGTPRQELDPWRQVEDIRHAITYATTLPSVDPDRIGIWGTSYSGGHSLVVGGTDRRVKCVVVQNPTISGHWSSLRRVPMDRIPAMTADFNVDRVNRMNGGNPTMRPLCGDLETHPIYPTGEVREFYDRESPKAPTWRNEVTLRTLEFARAYEPGAWIRFISPTPLLLIVGMQDTLTCYDLQLDAFNSAPEPKKLVLLDGGHFSCYDDDFEKAVTAATDWFVSHL